MQAARHDPSNVNLCETFAQLGFVTASDAMIPIAGSLSVGSEMPVVGFTLGQRVEGNPYWYADPQGDYVWAGATSVPSPSPAG